MKRPDSKTIFGICMGLGSLGAGLSKVLLSGWDDANPIWIVAGIAGFVAVIGFGVWSQRREHGEIRDRIERSSRARSSSTDRSDEADGLP